MSPQVLNSRMTVAPLVTTPPVPQSCVTNHGSSLKCPCSQRINNHALNHIRHLQSRTPYSLPENATTVKYDQRTTHPMHAHNSMDKNSTERKRQAYDNTQALKKGRESERERETKAHNSRTGYPECEAPLRKRHPTNINTDATHTRPCKIYIAGYARRLWRFQKKVAWCARFRGGRPHGCTTEAMPVSVP